MTTSCSCRPRSSRGEPERLRGAAESGPGTGLTASTRSPECPAPRRQAGVKRRPVARVDHPGRGRGGIPAYSAVKSCCPRVASAGSGPPASTSVQTGARSRARSGSSSRVLPLGDSTQPLAHPLPGSMKSVFTPGARHACSPDKSNFFRPCSTVRAAEAMRSRLPLLPAREWRCPAPARRRVSRDGCSRRRVPSSARPGRRSARRTLVASDRQPVRGPRASCTPGPSRDRSRATRWPARGFTACEAFRVPYPDRSETRYPTCGIGALS